MSELKFVKVYAIFSTLDVREGNQIKSSQMHAAEKQNASHLILTCVGANFCS